MQQIIERNKQLMQKGGMWNFKFVILFFLNFIYIANIQFFVVLIKSWQLVTTDHIKSKLESERWPTNSHFQKALKCIKYSTSQ